MIERRCNCIACASVRLAMWVAIAAFAALLLFAFLHRNDGRGRLLIEAVARPGAPAAEQGVQVQPVPVDFAARAKFPAVDAEAVDMLAFINRLVNAAITAEDDQTHYDQLERFVSFPADGKGDCEDYALSKMELLGNLGLPLAGNAVLQTVVVTWAEGSYGHMVLQVRLPHGAWIYLDSNFDEPMTRTELIAAGYRFFDWSDEQASLARPERESARDGPEKGQSR